MKIEGISAVFPERVVKNDEILEIIRHQSQRDFVGDFEKTLNDVEYYLSYSGAKERRWLDLKEPFFPYIEQAVNNALAQAKMTKSDIDMVIYASIDKRLYEPGMAAFVSGALGFNNTQCFDILEACNSWTRAVFLADALLTTKRAKSVLVISSEFHIHENAWASKNFKISSPDDLDWTFSSYTLGEVATATILTFDETNPWSFYMKNDNSKADLCFAPLDTYDESLRYMNQYDVNGKGARRFVSYSKPLVREATKLAKELLLTLYDNHGENPDIVIPHCYAENSWKKTVEGFEHNVPFYNIYSRYGNVASASIPASISEAVKEHKLKRDDSVYVIMTAAGISCASYCFRY